MLKKIDDFIDLERRGYTPRQQWNKLLLSPVLLSQLNDEPQKILKFVPGWEKKLEFIKLTESEKYNIAIIHLSTKDTPHRNYSKSDFIFWLQNTLENLKKEVGIIVFQTRELSHLNSASIGFLVMLHDQLNQKRDPVLVFSEMHPRIVSLFKGFGLNKVFFNVGPLDKFLSKMYFVEKKEFFYEVEFDISYFDED